MNDSDKSGRILITGGAGFIGSALVRHLLAQTNVEVINVDKLTYAGNLESLSDAADNPRYTFIQVDIGDGARHRNRHRRHTHGAFISGVLSFLAKIFL